MTRRPKPRITAPRADQVSREAHAPTMSASSTVKNLQELYTVTAGIALAWSIERLAGKGGAGAAAGDGPFDVMWTVLPTFVAFLVTLVPFYHGALRHLDRVYIDAAGRDVRRGSLLADFFLLFIEACFLVLAAMFVADAPTLGLVLAGLFALDAVWGLAFYLAFTRNRQPWVELRWVQINLIAGPLLAAIVLWGPHATGMAQQTILPVSVAAIAVLRTVFDYWLSWEIYFPNE